MATLFVSDLHLRPSRLEVLHGFVRFLERQRGRVEALYILGDLFEAWIGDDDPEPAYAVVREALRHCVDAGTPVFVMHGNRDFLIGPHFCSQSGCVLLPDPTRLELYGTPVLLMHGDSLCTGDRDYQTMRARLRAPGWQQQVLRLPLAERQALAGAARELSVLSSQGKDEHTMDVDPAEACRVVREYAVKLLIHGHTHRAGTYRLRCGDVRATRIDLGDWNASGSGLLFDAHGWRRLAFACTA